VKAGFVRSKQRYKCKDCGQFWTATRAVHRPLSERLLWLSLYVNGLSFNRIAHIFGVSDVAVLKFIRRFAEAMPLPLTPDEAVNIKAVQLDEMHHYLKKSHANFGSGRLLIISPDGSLPGSAVIVPLKH